MPEFLPDVPEVREDVADYLGECQAVDAYVGVLLKKLEDSGELERTIVVVSGDHGMPGVPGGQVQSLRSRHGGRAGRSAGRAARPGG